MEESESAARVALEKAERDANALKVENLSLRRMFEKSNADATRAETELKTLDSKFKVSNFFEHKSLSNTNASLLRHLVIIKTRWT